MARPVPTDLEDALAASPAARERFWSLPPEQMDSWVAYVERSRVPGARRRRVADTVRRLGAPERAVEERAVAAVPLPRDDRSLWLAGLALLIALAAFLLWLTVFRQHDDSKPVAVVVTAKTTVPKVTGISYQSAQFQLQDVKLTSKLTRRNATKPKGIVVAQAPKAGASVAQGTPVALVVSNGPAGVAMPDVVGLAAADAVKALQARKLSPTLEQTASKEAPGTVLAQQPQAGKRAKPGTTVVLQVAKGAVSVSVPDVTGQSQQVAMTTLTNAGLTVTTVQVPSTSAPGTVVAQSPAAGQEVAHGAKVRLNVAKGTTAPSSSGNDYTGTRLADAVQTIAQGRRQVIVQYVTSSRAAGVVVANSKAGSRERLQVSLGAHPKQARDVPDTTGEDAATAQQDLEAAGFALIRVDWPVSDSTQDGVVVYETPVGQIAQGSAIVIYVGSSTGG